MNRIIKIFIYLIITILVLVFIRSIIIDFVYFKNRRVQLVDTFSTIPDMSTNIIFKLTEIDPLNSNCKFDLLIIKYDSFPNRNDLQIIIEEGNVLNAGSMLISETNNVLSRAVVHLENPIVQKINNLFAVTYEKKDIEINLSDCLRGYFYPFDVYRFRVRLHIPEYKSFGSVYFLLNEPRYIHSRPISIVSYGRKMTPINNSVFVSLYRPFYQKSLTVIVILFLLIIAIGQFILLLLKSEFDMLAILGLNVSIIFGIIGLRPLLAPDNIDFVPAIDLSFLIILILTFINIIFVIIRQKRSRLINSQ